MTLWIKKLHKIFLISIQGGHLFTTIKPVEPGPHVSYIVNLIQKILLSFFLVINIRGLMNEEEFWIIKDWFQNNSKLLYSMHHLPIIQIYTLDSRINSEWLFELAPYIRGQHSRDVLSRYWERYEASYLQHTVLFHNKLIVSILRNYCLSILPIEYIETFNFIFALQPQPCFLKLLITVDFSHMEIFLIPL